MLARCSLCPCTRGRSPVLPSGPSQPCRIAAIGEAPARHEDAKGIPFVGQTGMELDGQYLPLAGLDRSEVPICNSVYCSQPNYRNPTPEEALCCSSKHLPDFLNRTQPEILLVMGAVACSLFPNINLNIHHGIPLFRSFGSWSGIVFPTFHPAAGLRSSQYMILIRSDMRALKSLLSSSNLSLAVSSRIDPHPSPDYNTLHTVKDLYSYLHSHPYFELSTDTESRPDSSPFCLTFSHTHGTARLIYASNTTVLSEFFSYIVKYRPLLSLHSYLHDTSVYEQLGHTIAPYRFLDTMVQAFELCLGGGGDEEESGGRGSLSLKILAYRHLNMAMTSFSDTVVPYAIPHVLSWISAAELAIEQPDEEPLCECGHSQHMHAARGKSGRKTGSCLSVNSAPNSAADICGCLKWKKVDPPKKDKETGLLVRKLRSLSKAIKDSQDVDPWDRLKGWYDWERELLEMVVGPVPVPDVALVPADVLQYYACRDSDATLRLRKFLNSYKQE